MVIGRPVTGRAFSPAKFRMAKRMSVDQGRAEFGAQGEGQVSSSGREREVGTETFSYDDGIVRMFL